MKEQAGKAPVTGAAGERAYAIGDVHGRLDLLDAMLARIEEDRRGREAKKTYIVFLGDLVDRGPDSKGVVDRVRNYAPDDAEVIVLAGNHEEVFARVLEGEEGLLSAWLQFGGSQCMQSYGLAPAELLSLTETDGLQLIRSQVPPEHREFLSGLANSFRFGDYVFVHAGIRPGVPLEEQEIDDLRWIREPFLSHRGRHGFVVVHGHTIVEQVEERANRIALDTGAYRSGVLTAVGIEDGERWFLTSTGDSDV